MKRTLLLAVACLFALPAQAQFLDAASVRPILDATKANWIAVRRFDGQDLLYFTHLLAWRCGLDGISYSVNDITDEKSFPMVPCDESAAQPAAIGEGDTVYLSFPLDSINTVSITLHYDDGSTDTVAFDRKAVEIQ